MRERILPSLDLENERERIFMYKIPGHHHISMIIKDAKRNNHFYKNILGLRRVKVTVNQDDPSMYHLFYGDKTGSPGTELTFFEFPMVGKTYRRTNAITRIGLIVPSEESLPYWKARFTEQNVYHLEISVYAGSPALKFMDPEGLQLVLVAANEKKQDFWQTWEKSAVPAEHQIQGLGPVEMTVRRPEKLASLLVDMFGYTEVSRSGHTAVFQSVPGEMFGEIVVKQMEGPKERPGRGSIHHLAIRARHEEELRYWDEQVRARGFRSSGIIDRYYFKSIYFRESNGILFEIATDEPGFLVDGNIDTLGEQLDLPPFLESRRAEIEKNLKLLDKD